MCISVNAVCWPRQVVFLLGHSGCGCNKEVVTKAGFTVLHICHVYMSSVSSPLGSLYFHGDNATSACLDLPLESCLHQYPQAHFSLWPSSAI